MCGKTDISEAGFHTELCSAGITFYRNAVRQGRAVRDGAPDCLESLGLLTPAVDDPDAVIPVPPEMATVALTRPLEEEILRQQREMAAVRTTMSQVESVYRDLQGRDGKAVQPLAGESVIAAAIDEAVRCTRVEALSAHPGGGRPQRALVQALPLALEARERGIQQRRLYQHTVRTHGPTLDYIKAVTEVGVEVRTVNEVFDRLLVYDRTVAFIPDVEKSHRDHALRVTDPGIVHFLVSVFEHAWERAQAIVYTDDHHRPRLLTDETRLRVLRLMVDGYTDAAIATRLGMSTRSVASHLKKVSDMLGSKSRAQLAYLTAQSGLLDEPVRDGVEAAP
ncbi:helix-turn-helix transcriptional regulator [Streptomyces acidiscabies]|uniref:helix-turn-helix transcriptional regulator n=1 Tax=Streptomyces acidiscabies TaxID=42234 RepID=UPI00073E5857|nr:LuxR C-terminal-related transcriptional regulator [Streptomyces acidiscabies]GAQ58326.1 bacterial regulatory proteins, luxR family [Streptomyces acidiscabies]